MSQWPRVTLGKLIKSIERREAVIPEQKYRLLGVRWYGQGLFIKEEKFGFDVRAPHLYKVENGDFVYSRLFAWKGSFANATEIEHGCYVSNEFPCFHPTNRIDPSFLLWYFSREIAWSEALGLSSGATPTSRNRLSEARFLGMLIPLPSIDEQRAIVTRLDAIADKVRQVEAKLDEIEADAERLLAIRFRKIIEDVKWQTMAEVAPLVRREVEVDLEGSYPELGIRSFGKGTFHKPPLEGADVGSKRLFSIEPGDLLFSNVFAWEGAIAVAKNKDVGRFGSHRFISCLANPEIVSPEFLRYYFLTPQGLEKIGEASPGGAGRNRTLGLEKLMVLQVPTPQLAKQQAFDKLQTKLAEMKAKHTETRQALKALLPSMLEQIFN